MMWLLESWKVSFRRFDKWLFVLLLIRLLIPAIYNNIRISILGSLSDNTNAFKIVSQLIWVQIALEVFEEALLLPLYHCFGTAANDNETLRGKFRSGLSICLIFYSIFCGILAAFTPQFVKMMAQEKSLVKETTNYLRLELASIFSDGIGKFADLFLVVKKRTKLLLIKLVIQMLCSITFDIFFFSKLSVSLQLGTTGVAYSSMSRSCITLLVGISMAFFTIKLFPRQFFTFHRRDYSWLSIWTVQGCFSGLDSLIRNSVYALIVIRGMNLLNEQGTYWIANTFIWSWLLLPVLALSEMLRQDLATNHPQQTYQVILPAYMHLSFIVVFIWAITIPSWKPFISNVLNAGDSSKEAVELVYQLVPGYIFFIISSLSRAVFYAKGKIQYIVISCVVASIVLVTLFLMMIYKVLPSNVKVVAGIFEANMIIGSITAILLVLWFMRQRSDVVHRVGSSDGENINSETPADCKQRKEKEPLNQKND